MHVWTCKHAEISLTCRLCARSYCWSAGFEGYHVRLLVPSAAPCLHGDVQILLAATLTVVQGAVLMGSAAGAYSQASVGGMF